MKGGLCSAAALSPSPNKSSKDPSFSPQSEKELRELLRQQGEKQFQLSDQRREVVVRPGVGAGGA